MSNIEITDQNIKAFSATAKKYGIDFALKKDTTGEIPRYLVFFKGRDAEDVYKRQGWYRQQPFCPPAVPADSTSQCRRGFGGSRRNRHPAGISKVFHFWEHSRKMCIRDRANIVRRASHSGRKASW